MFHTIGSALAHEALERATLLVNHVLLREPEATRRLGAHVGRTLRLQLEGRPPAWLPPMPELSFRITPAALVEWTGVAPAARVPDLGPDLGPDRGPDRGPDPALDPMPEPAVAAAPADLLIVVQMPGPLTVLRQAAAGIRPGMEVSGDAAFAADVNWLFDHLRWDLEDDLAGVVGALPARQMARLGRGLAAGLREAVNSAGSLAERLRRGGPAA